MGVSGGYKDQTVNTSTEVHIHDKTLLSQNKPNSSSKTFCDEFMTILKSS
jgi:hypothetical protein